MFFGKLRSISALLDHVLIRCFKAESEICELKRRNNSSFRALNKKCERDFRFFCGMYNDLRSYADKRLDELKKYRDLSEKQIHELKNSLASALSRLDAFLKKYEAFDPSCCDRFADFNSCLSAVNSRLADFDKSLDAIDSRLADFDIRFADFDNRLDAVEKSSALAVNSSDSSGTELLSGFDNRKYNESEEKVTARQILNEWLNGDSLSEGKK